MSDQHELQRVRSDLEAVRQAAALEIPVDWSDVYGCLLLAASGFMAGVFGLVLPLHHLRLAMMLVFVPVVLFFIAQTLQRRRSRAWRPALWREMRLTWIVLLVAVPLMCGYMHWEREMGLPREWVGASAVFFIGASILVLSIVDRTRRHYGIGGVSLMVFGLFIPFCSLPQLVLLSSGSCVVIGLTSGWKGSLIVNTM